MKTLYDYIIYKHINCLEQHFKLEFDIRDISNLTVNVHKKYGRYNGEIEFIVEIAKQLFSDIKNNINKDITFNINKKDIEGFENIFFDNIQIIYKDNISNSGYNNSNVKYNKDTKILNNIVIYI